MGRGIGKKVWEVYEYLAGNFIKGDVGVGGTASWGMRALNM